MKATSTNAVLLLVGAALCGFFFQLGERRLLAVEGPCDPADCKTVYGWLATSGDVLAAHEVASTTRTTYAVPQIYVQGTTETIPRVKSGQYDRWNFTKSDNDCKKIGGVYPKPQEVVPYGTSTNGGTFDRYVCTYNP